MGVLIDGKWTDEQLPEETGKAGNFRRVDSRFRGFITADGSSGFRAEAGRYHLYIAYNCPWAHRTLVFRKLKGLEGMISISSARLTRMRTSGAAPHTAAPGEDGCRRACSRAARSCGALCSAPKAAAARLSVAAMRSA